MLASLDLQIDPEATVKHLGVAQQQMVEIAKALSLDARLIIMDEPTATLTSHEIDRLFEAIGRLKQRGVAIVYVSHRLDEVKAICDRATILRDGAYVGTVPVASTTIDRDDPPDGRARLEGQVPEGRGRTAARKCCASSSLRARASFTDSASAFGAARSSASRDLSGSKRTETARAIFGADPIDSGRIFLHGKPVKVRTPADAIAHRIALVPEDRKRHGIFASLSVWENIVLSALRHFSRSGILDLRARSSARRSSSRRSRVATPDLEKRVLDLSGGNQQKVVIAKWLNTNAEVFLFDEPTRGIDVGGKIEVYQTDGRAALARRRHRHDFVGTPEILGLSDRILVMREGRICGEFDRAEATEENILNCALRGAPAA